MGKSTRAPTLAAGGIVIRHDPKPQIAVVQRRRDRAWVLPKGKLKRNEEPIAAAKREVMEETGCEVRVYEFLGLISHPGGSRPKITHFWRMQAIDDSVRRLTSDIKAVKWLPLPAAVERLSLPHEQSFLREVGPHALGRALEEAPLVQPMPAIAELLPDQAPPVVLPARAPALRPKSPSRSNVLARLIQRLFGQQSNPA
jgi:8-oxo-dGTP diphosphatase